MGVRIGDEIEKVNDKSVRYSTHAQIVTTIHEVGCTACLSCFTTQRKLRLTNFVLYLQSVREGRITLMLRRINLPMPGMIISFKSERVCIFDRS